MQPSIKLDDHALGDCICCMMPTSSSTMLKYYVHVDTCSICKNILANSSLVRQRLKVASTMHDVNMH